MMTDAQEAGGTDASTTLITAFESVDLCENVHGVSSKPSSTETHIPNTTTTATATAPEAPTSDPSTSNTSPAIAAEIVRQVEFYFSDANLPTDEFMLKQIKAGGEQGWVALREIAAFRKIKKLSRDAGYIAESLRKSSELEVSEDGLHVRRLAAMPDVDLDEVRLRTIIADNLPAEKPTIEFVMEMFGKAGEVLMARIRKPDAPEPLLTKGLRNKISQGALTYALVEYATAQQAQQAVDVLDNSDDWRNGMRVRRILSKKSAPMVVKAMPAKQIHGVPGTQHTLEGTQGEGTQGEGTQGEGARESKGPRDDSSSEISSSEPQPQQQQKHSQNQEGRGKVSKRRSKPDYAAWASGSAPGSSGGGGEAGSGEGAPGKPRGPDGTRGFGVGRGMHVAVPPGLAPMYPPGLVL